MNWRSIEPERAALGVGLTLGFVIGMFADRIVAWVGEHPYLSVVAVWYVCCVIAIVRVTVEMRHGR